MKKLIISNVLAIVMCGILCSQPVLVYEIHGLKTGIDNQMIYTQFADPGFSGADVSWDFSSLPYEKPFTGFLNSSVTSEIGSTFSRANTELIEFDSRFYFTQSSEKIEELGYSSPNGKTQIRYENPSIKMKYPFRYGDSFSGSLSGYSVYNGVKTGSITGTYLVVADAYGQLILPDDQHFQSTLRIRSEKCYVNRIGNSYQEVNIITYRWYDLNHRYPILVLTEYSVKTNNVKTVHYQAAYNNKQACEPNIISDEGITLYPNPAGPAFHLILNSNYEGYANIDIYDLSGNKVRSFQRTISHAGSNELDLSAEIAGLKPAGYLLVVTCEVRVFKKNFTLIE